MKRRWRLVVDPDWEIVAIVVWAAWAALGIVAIVVAGEVFKSETAMNLAGATTMLGIVGIPLLALIAWGVCRLRASQVIGREWQSGPDLRERYRERGH